MLTDVSEVLTASIIIALKTKRQTRRRKNLKSQIGNEWNTSGSGLCS
jgi:hypothetical protein